MFRASLVLCAAPAGLAAGFLAWMAAGGPSAAATTLAPLQADVARLRAPRPGGAPSAPTVADLVSTPLFHLTTGPGAVTLPALRLEGVSRTGRRVAALLSIDNKPAEWLTPGETRDGVTLQDVSGAKVVVDTLLGPQEVALGERAAAAPVAAAPAASAASSTAGQTLVDQMPPGFRSPPPPASAPRQP